MQLLKVRQSLLALMTALVLNGAADVYACDSYNCQIDWLYQCPAFCGYSETYYDTWDETGTPWCWCREGTCWAYSDFGGCYLCQYSYFEHCVGYA